MHRADLERQLISGMSCSMQGVSVQLQKATDEEEQLRFALVMCSPTGRVNLFLKVGDVDRVCELLRSPAVTAELQLEPHRQI
ncbi:hypothetical protein HY375_00230 [Candidatus Berkelbacteria bacterium]|nr:hypothetical protein [Candidatus Berkelbacteria bacterium]